MRPRRPGDGWLDGNRVEAQKLGDHEGRGDPITMFVASGGRGDAGPFRLGCTNVWRGVTALVAIGGGADGESAQGSRSSSRGGKGQHGDNGRTLGRTFAIVVVIVTSERARPMHAPVHRSATAT